MIPAVAAAVLAGSTAWTTGSAVRAIASGAAARSAGSPVDAATILERVDANARMPTAYMEASLVIESGGRRMTKTMRIWEEGNGSKALVEFTNPGDRGTRYLKVGSEMWIYSPEAEEVVRISGHMLRQGMMGSDFSYQDALESEQLRMLYDASLAGEELVDGKACYVLELTAKPGREVSYYRRKVWVSQAEWVALKEELYAPSGKILKRLSARDVRRAGERYYPAEAIMENLLRRGTRTTMTITRLDMGVEIPAGTFSLQRLTGR